MEHIIFETVAFVKTDYSHAYVTGSSLVIVLVNKTELFVDYPTKDAAKDGLSALHAKLYSSSTSNQEKTKEFGLDDLVGMLTSGKGDKITSVLQNVQERLDSVLSGVKETVQEKALEKALKEVTKATEERVDGLVKNLDDVLSYMFTKEIVTEEPKDEAKEEKVQPQPTIITKAKRSFGIVDDVFGFTNVKTPTEEELDITEVLIGDMTTKQLREEISKFVDSIISSERASDMFQSITANFDAETAQAAIEAFKGLIYQVAIANPEKTLDEVLRENFK